MSHHLLVRLYEIICIKHNFISLHICLVKVYCTIICYHHMNCICIYIKVVQIKTVDIWNNVWVSEQTQLCVVCRTLSAWQRYIVCSTLCTLLIAYGQSHGHGHGFGHNHGLSAVETKEEGRKDTSLSCTFSTDPGFNFCLLFCLGYSDINICFSWNDITKVQNYDTFSLNFVSQGYVDFTFRWSYL